MDPFTTRRDNKLSLSQCGRALDLKEEFEKGYLQPVKYKKDIHNSFQSELRLSSSNASQ